MPDGLADILPPGVTRRPITVDEYHKMGETGVLHEDGRAELIEGQLIQAANTLVIATLPEVAFSLRELFG